MSKEIKKVLIRGALVGIVGGMLMCGFAWALVEGLNREADRQDAVREYNCKHYGAAINKTYGQELCPPTPQG